MHEGQPGLRTDIVLTETRRKVAARRAIDCIDRALRIGVDDEITTETSSPLNI